MQKSNIKSFLPLERLGQGSFASVYKVKRVSDNQIYALKKIKMGKLCKKSKENALNQVRLLTSLSCPYITTCYEAFFDESLEALCIVMQYAGKGDLRKMISTYKKQGKIIAELDIWKVMIHLLYGLRVLHNNKILHRDLKCENIFVFEHLFKIGDMNVSKINKKGFVQTQTGTPYYASPQVWRDEPYDEKSDIWSLGCILYELAALNPPFRGNSMNQLYKHITQSRHQEIPQCYSRDLSLLISSCLRKVPGERPTVQSLLSDLTVKLYENICIVDEEERSGAKQMSKPINLLKTINFPHNIHELNSVLPSSSYKTPSKQQHCTAQKQSISKPEQQQLNINDVKALSPNQVIKIVNANRDISRRGLSLKKQYEPKGQENNEQQRYCRIQVFNCNQAESDTKESERQNDGCQMQRMIDKIQIKSKGKSICPMQGCEKGRSDKLSIKSRRVLKEIQNTNSLKPTRNRSQSLPRTQNRQRSISKESSKKAQKNLARPQGQVGNLRLCQLIDQRVRADMRAGNEAMQCKAKEMIVGVASMASQAKRGVASVGNGYGLVIDLARRCLERGHSRRYKLS